TGVIFPPHSPSSSNGCPPSALAPCSLRPSKATYPVYVHSTSMPVSHSRTASLQHCSASSAASSDITGRELENPNFPLRRKLTPGSRPRPGPDSFAAGKSPWATGKSLTQPCILRGAAQILSAKAYPYLSARPPALLPARSQLFCTSSASTLNPPLPRYSRMARAMPSPAPTLFPISNSASPSSGSTHLSTRGTVSAAAPRLRLLPWATPTTRFSSLGGGGAMLTNFTSTFPATAFSVSRLVCIWPFLPLSFTGLRPSPSRPLRWLELGPPSRGPCERALATK
ncbi:hypothetical protein C8R46DRAFT_1293759, partial [Mycena filopes]